MKSERADALIARSAPAGAQRLPNLVIAGVTKAGTTSLFGYLGQHPDICPTRDKEVDHFTPLVHGGEPGDLSNYATQFSKWAGEPWRLEASPRYFIGGRPLAERLVRDLPDLHVVITLRDPVTRLWSSYTFKKSKGRLPVDMRFGQYFDRCLSVFEAGTAREVEALLFRALTVGRYADYLNDWFEVCGDRLRVVFFEQLVQAPRAQVARLCHWLGAATEPLTGFDFGVRNRTAQPRSLALRGLAFRFGRATRPLLDRHPELARALKSSYRRLNTGTLGEEMTPADRARVAEFYRPTFAPLRELLLAHGYADLPAWLAPAATTTAS